MQDFIEKYGLDTKFSKLKLVLNSGDFNLSGSKNNNKKNSTKKKNIKYNSIKVNNSNREKIKIGIGLKKNLVINEKFTFIAGPCSIESEKQAFIIAEKLINIGIDIFRGGVFKPRTSPYDFQGMEEKGLEILLKIKQQFKIPVITEAITIEHLHFLKDKVDIIQIGARNMFNYPLLKEAGKINVPILLKRANNATYYEWLSSAEYILSNGNNNVILCERGIRTFETSTRNTLDLAAIPFLKNITNLPVFFDPSHGTGIAELIEPMSLAGAAAGADGIIIEVHNQPDTALSDKLQQITCEQFKVIYEKILKIKKILI